MFSMNRPSRGLRESATTTRYDGRLVAPIRINLIFTICVVSSSLRWQPQTRRELRQARHLPTPSPEPGEAHHGLHHLPGLGEVLEERVDLRGGGARAASDAKPPAAVDDSGVPS